MRIIRKFACLMLILSVGISGCGSEEVLKEEEEIALLEPLDSSEGWEAAACRNLYDAEVYSSTVLPYTEEYSFGKDVVLDKFLAFPGESVERGEILACADNSALEKEIEKKEEQMLEMEEEFQSYKKETEEALYDKQIRLERLEGVVEWYLETEPGEQLNPAYAQWEKEYNRYNEEYRTLALDVDRTETQLEHKTQLFELDYEYAGKQLKRMKAELGQGILTSPMEGNVVALVEWGSGSRIGKEKVIAIGDLSQKLLKCQYINKSIIAGAKDIYALINGKRYEIRYQPIDAQEYARRTAQNEVIYSVFELTEDAEDVSVGDYAVITVVRDSRENVLSVPESAIHKDAGSSFVYVIKEGESVAVNVETGMSDGVYREILGGIAEGDKVLTSNVMTGGTERAVVERGDFCSYFSGRGYISYPSSHMAENSIKYGRVYFVDYAVTLYEYVEKGDVIAEIRVKGDEIALERNRVKLARLEERLANQIQQGTEGQEKVIAQKQEEIDKLKELIEEMTADYATTQIRAEREGIIISLAEYAPEDIIEANAQLAKIADEDTCYVILENSKQFLQYGNQVEITYKDKEGVSKDTYGMVVSLSKGGVAGSGFKTENSWILLPPEEVGDMVSVVPAQNGFVTRVSITVEAEVRQMNQVLLVPRAAVWEVGNQKYVLVAGEEGVVARSFIAGGYDASHYWVVDGLTEGMELCLK